MNNNPTLDEVAKAIEIIRRHNADANRDIYLDQHEFVELLGFKDQVQRVRKLHKPIEDGLIPLVCDSCYGSYENLVLYPCPTIQALDDEKSQVREEQVMSEPRDISLVDVALATEGNIHGTSITVTSYPVLMLSTDKLKIPQSSDGEQ